MKIKGGEIVKLKSRQTCRICKEVRTINCISVLTKDLTVNGERVGSQNIQFCNDNPDCRKKAEDFCFIKEALKDLLAKP